MGALLESGLVGNIGLKHLKVIKEDTINKWDKLGFLDGLAGHLKETATRKQGVVELFLAAKGDAPCSQAQSFRSTRLIL